MKFTTFLTVFVLANAGVLKNQEDRPIQRTGTPCENGKCPENQRCEMSMNSECDDENRCSVDPVCVPIPVQKPKCGENEEVKDCGSACEPTCENANQECSLQCLTDVCQCKSGFVRDSESNKCVQLTACRPRRCSLECAGNEKCEVVETNCEQEPCPSQEVCALPNVEIQES